MATGNFYVKNANDVYAFGMKAEDCFDFDDSLDCIKEAGISRYGFEETSGSDGDRNYCGEYILNKDFGCRDFYNSDLSVNIDITIIARSGYYQGANLDFELEVRNDYYDPYKLGDYESEEELIDAMADEFVDYCDDVYNYGLRKCFKKRYKAFLEDYIDKAIEYANNVLKDLCEEEYCNVLKNTHSTVSLGFGVYVSNIEDNSDEEVKFFNYGEMDDEASLEVISTGMTYEEMKKDGKLLYACLSNPMVNYNNQSITVEKAQKIIDFFSGKSKTIPLTFNGLLAYYGKDFYKHYQMYKLLPTATTRKIFSNANIEIPEDVIKDF